MLSSALSTCDGVGHDRPQIGGEAGLDLDRLAQAPAQQLVHAAYQVVEIEAPGAQRLAPRIGQQLLGQAGAALGRDADDLELAAQRRGHVPVIHQKLGIAEDDGQEIVEVVRDAAAQLADGFHLLELTELLLASSCAR